MTRQTRNWLIALLVIYSVPVFVVGGIIAFLALRPLPPLVPPPNPNAYDDLVKAGQMVSTNTGNYAKLGAPQLRTLAATNAAALSLARDALDGPCRVPVQYSQTNWSLTTGNVSKLRLLSQAFAAEGKLAELDKRSGKAAGCDMDLIRLGADSARGGILIDAMIGSSIESIGSADLVKLASQLDAPTCRDAAATLERLDAEKPSWDGVMKQEDDWIRRTFGMRAVLVEFIFHRQVKRSGMRTQKSYQAEQLKLRRLMIDFAARAFELEKGHRPASAAELVPEYLKAVPKNPTTGKNLN
jgi:hypothetical protein